MTAFRLILIAFLMVWTLAANAQSPMGPTVLTIAGNITKPNRGAVDPFVDAFFSFGEVEFEKAAAFDLAKLQSLGMKKLSVRYPDWPRGFTFEGPLLRDVLAEAGASGTVVRVRALDGYAAEIPMEEVRKYPILLALKRDGVFLGLGDRGPSWLVFPRDDYPELGEEDEAKWVWSAYFIAVE